jgi:hypothetical protein
MIFNMVSDILDPVKPNYCPLLKNLLQILGFDSFVVGEQSELAGFHIF